MLPTPPPSTLLPYTTLFRSPRTLRAARRRDRTHTLPAALRPRLVPVRPNDPPQPEARHSALSQQHLSLTRPCAPSQQRGLRVQRARSRGLRLPSFSEARVAVRPVPRET